MRNYFYEICFPCQTAADALSRFFTKKERSNDRDENSPKNPCADTNNDSKCVDFKEQFREVFNTYFSLCIHTAGQLAAIPLPLPGKYQGSGLIPATPVPEISFNSDSAAVGSTTGSDTMNGVCGTGNVSMVIANGSNGVIDKMFSSTVSEICSETENSSNIRDLLEAFLNSVCTATDYAALSLSGESSS